MQLLGDATRIGTMAPKNPVLEWESTLGGIRKARKIPRKERRLAKDRRDCYWLNVMVDRAGDSTFRDPAMDPARFPRREVSKVQRYWIEVDAVAEPMTSLEDGYSCGKKP